MKITGEKTIANSHRVTVIHVFVENHPLLSDLSFFLLPFIKNCTLVLLIEISLTIVTQLNSVDHLHIYSLWCAYRALRYGAQLTLQRCQQVIIMIIKQQPPYEVPFSMSASLSTLPPPLVLHDILDRLAHAVTSQLE